MEKLIIEPSQYSPNIILDPINNFYEISGQSIPENAMDIYKPVFDWIDKNLEKIPNKIEFNIKLDYFNTASAKMLLDMFLKLEEYCKKGKEIEIKWYYDKEDTDMKDAGQDYADEVQVPFKIIPNN